MLSNSNLDLNAKKYHRYIHANQNQVVQIIPYRTIPAYNQEYYSTQTEIRNIEVEDKNSFIYCNRNYRTNQNFRKNKENCEQIQKCPLSQSSRYNKQKSLIKVCSQKNIKDNLNKNAKQFQRATLKQLTQQYELSLSNRSYKLTLSRFRNEINFQQQSKLRPAVSNNQNQNQNHNHHINYKLCINCLTYVNCTLLNQHQTNCLGFSIILKMSREQLIQFIDQKIEKKLLQIGQLNTQIQNLLQKQISQKTKLQGIIKKSDQFIEDLSKIRLNALLKLQKSPAKRP